MAFVLALVLAISCHQVSQDAEVVCLGDSKPNSRSNCCSNGAYSRAHFRTNKLKGPDHGTVQSSNPANARSNSGAHANHGTNNA